MLSFKFGQSIFRDIFTAMTNGEVNVALKHLILNYIRKNHSGIDVVVGLDARGFLFSFMIASELGISCVPVRKKGKLPGECLSVEYALEYGTDSFELQVGSIKKGQKVLLIDDLIATGGSLAAATKLITNAGGVVEVCLAIMELTALNGRAKIDAPVHSFIQYSDL